MSSLTDMNNVALRHMLRFVPAYTLANVECVTPRMGRVARAAVVELTASRFGITVEPVSGCAWRMLVQEGLADAGCHIFPSPTSQQDLTDSARRPVGPAP